MHDDQEPVSLRKSRLRRAMRQRLAALCAESRARRSLLLLAQLTALRVWQKARSVVLFAPLPTEVDLDRLWSTDALAGKTCAYPRIDGARLALFAVGGLNDLEPGPWSLRQPSSSLTAEINPRDCDLILIPGLAFTRAGKRLGRGGGFYDRLLAAAGPRPCKIGVAFACQVVDDLPSKAHDIPVDLVITDEPGV